MSINSSESVTMLSTVFLLIIISVVCSICIGAFI